ncbi:MAG: type II secretion system protein [Bacilli bacterium]|nr:type II secretion system protein [Bacilli bacterium]
MRKINNGFTLVEILAVIVVLGIIMIVALPTYSNIYNSIKLTTYLNNVKTVKSAALDYGNNTYIKDSIKQLHDSSKNDWCSTISIQNLIKAGYIKSDDDYNDQITDVFTGGALGYNLVSNFDDSYSPNSVALCFCSNQLDIDAFIINDLAKDNVYHEGEYVRNLVYSNDATGEKVNKYEFRELKVSFIYNDLAKRIVRAKNNGSSSITVEGVEMNISNYFDGISLSSMNDDFVKALNKAIFDYLTYDSTCPFSN